MSIYFNDIPEEIRLVIWDLDDTFWKGTLSEGNIEIPEKNINIIKELTNRGIVNSICSKNDREQVKNVLMAYGVWDYFVFPKINWGSKGGAIKEIVENVKLRPESILFIDDNKTNIGEVKYTLPEINVSLPDSIDYILNDSHFLGSDDKNHSRLQHYKILEEKHKDEIIFSNSEEFLIQSSIQVEICREEIIDNIERIYELNQRSNQLNYTKVRLTREEIISLVNDKNYDTGYIKVSDKYGDYGIVGFFASKKINDGENILEQYFFSCRTLGLGVEQWVYSQLKFPSVNILGTVATNLKKDFFPNWINLNKEKKELKILKKNKFKILIIGGCDLEQVAFYLEQSGIMFDKQFNYTNIENIDVHPDSSEVIRSKILLSNKKLDYIIETCPFYDKRIFDIKFFKKTYDIIIYSPLIDTILGFYQNKKYNDIFVVYGNSFSPDLEGNGYMNLIEQKKFLKDFDFLGRIEKERFKENLSIIRNYIHSNTKLIILNFGEYNIKHPYEPDIYKFNIEMNNIIDSFVEENKINTFLIDVRSLAKGDMDYTDNIRHYTRKVYYEISKKIIEVLQEVNCLEKGNVINSNIKLKINYRQEVKKILRRTGMLNMSYKIYNFIKNLKIKKIFK